MRKRVSACFIVVGVASVLLAACSESQPHQTPQVSTPIQREDALRIAREVAIQQGAQLDGFKAPEARLDTHENDVTWVVRYWGRKNTPGNYFDVLVEARTGNATFVPGE